MRRRCCCTGSDRCSCPSNASGFTPAGSCSCNTVNCATSGPLQSCCTRQWTVSASCDGMLYSPNAYTVFRDGDPVTADVVADTWAPGAPPSCVWCATSGPCTAGNTPNDLVSFNTGWPCRTYPSLPWTIQRFVASPSGCQSWMTAVTPLGERFSPDACTGPDGCWVSPHLSSWRPQRYRGSMGATFKMLVSGANRVTPTLCNLSGYVSVNIQKLSTTSDCAMANASWDITCKVLSGRAYFVLQVAWTPLIDYVAYGHTWLGCDESGPRQQSFSGVAWPGPGWSFAPAGCSTVPPNAILVRYRMPVSAAAGAHACGVGTGTYEPYEVANPAYYHASSLAAFGPATVA